MRKIKKWIIVKLYKLVWPLIKEDFTIKDEVIHLKELPKPIDDSDFRDGIEIPRLQYRKKK